MKLKDYIFYRMYLAYKKHEGAGRFTTVLYFAWIEMFLTFPFTFIVLIAVKAKSDFAILSVIIIPAAIIFLLNYKRYFKKGKIEELKSKFGNSKYNYRIKNWMLYLLPLFSSACGIAGIYPVSKLTLLILSLVRVNISQLKGLINIL